MKRLYVKSIPCSSREQAVLCSTDQDPAGPGPSRSRENDGELWEGEARARGGAGGAGGAYLPPLSGAVLGADGAGS